MHSTKECHCEDFFPHLSKIYPEERMLNGAVFVSRELTTDSIGDRVWPCDTAQFGDKIWSCDTAQFSDKIWSCDTAQFGDKT